MAEDSDDWTEKAVRARVRRARSRLAWEIVKWVGLLAVGHYLEPIWNWMATR